MRIEHVSPDGEVTVLKQSTPVLVGEVLDAAVMRRAALDEFLAEQVSDAKDKGVLFSVHLKATMMKVSDPILFGHAVRAYFATVFAEHGEVLNAAGVNANDGLAAMLKAIEGLPGDQRSAARGGDRRRLPGGPGAGDGRRRPGNHQPARAQRRDHRCARCPPRSAPRVRCGIATASFRTRSS